MDPVQQRLRTMACVDKSWRLVAVGVLAAVALACAGPAASTPDPEEPADQKTPTATRLEPARDFDSAPDLKSSRERFAVIRLADGRLLAVGGRARGMGGLEAGNFNETAELLDPKTLEWTLTGSLEHKRRSPALIQLSDGRVLAAGGTNEHHRPMASVEVWSPGDGEWSAASDMIAARDSMGAIALRDGRVLVTGGAGFDEDESLVPSIASCEIYDPGTGEWSTAAPMSETRVNHTATLLADGRVLVVGGGEEDSYSNTAEVYDPGEDTWTVAAPLDATRAFHTATLLTDGRVLVVGGRGKRTLAEIYDPDSNKWEPAGETALPRAEHAATLLSDGRVLVTGGIGHLAPSEVFDPSTQEWSTVGSLRTGRYRHGAVRLTDGRILVMGGTGSEGILASAEVLTSVGYASPTADGSTGERPTPLPDPTPTRTPTPEPTPTEEPAIDEAALEFAEPVDADPGIGKTSVELATPVRLGIGQEISSPLGPGGLIVEFLGVVEDTRCPVGETCAEPGRAVIRVKLRVPAGPLGESEIALEGGQAGPTVQKFGRYSLVFLALEPEPAAGVDLDPDEAIAILAVIQPGR